MEVNYFQIVLIDVTLWPYHALKAVLIVVIIEWKTQYIRHRRLEG